MGIGLLQSYKGSVFAYIGFGCAMSVFILHGFIKSIPLELEEAANAGFFAKTFLPFANLFPIFLRESLFAIAPLFALFVIFQLTLLKMTVRQSARIIVGFVYAYFGLVIFLTGVNGGLPTQETSMEKFLESWLANAALPEQAERHGFFFLSRLE